MKTYFGNPCARNHTGERYSNNGGCIHCALEKSRRFEQIRKKDSKVAAKVRDKNRETMRQRRKNHEHREKERIYNTSEETRQRKLNWQRNRRSDKEYRRELRRREAEISAVRIKTDTEYHLKRVLRSRLYSAVKGTAKIGSAIRELGCSPSFLKQYLESQFLPGMSWENYGYYGWHIDHIKPLSTFDLTDPDQFRRACHYTNLQPMWAFDNLSKGSRITNDLFAPVVND